MTHWITSWFKLWVWGTVTSWFCRHDYKWYRNVYGDEINHVDWRTEYRCVECGKIRGVPFLVIKR